MDDKNRADPASKFHPFSADNKDALLDSFKKGELFTDRYRTILFWLYLDGGQMFSKRLGITVFQPRLKVSVFARKNHYEYGKQRQCSDCQNQTRISDERKAEIEIQ